MFRGMGYAVLTAAMLLTACGGGGDDDGGNSPPVATAEGVWYGSASTGWDTVLVVLESGESWGIYIDPSNGLINGALHGETTWSDGVLQGSAKDFNLSSRTATAFTYTGTYALGEPIKLQLADGASFEGSYWSPYGQPASLSAIAGTYSGSIGGDDPAATLSFAITPAGVVERFPAPLGCTANGAVTPHPGGKNVFNISVSFSGDTCPVSNRSRIDGVALYDGVTFFAMGLSSDETAGFFFQGRKDTPR